MTPSCRTITRRSFIEQTHGNVIQKKAGPTFCLAPIKPVFHQIVQWNMQAEQVIKRLRRKS